MNALVRVITWLKAKEENIRVSDLTLSFSLTPPGKAHIRRAILGHEEALRIYSLCRHLNKLEVLQEILIASHERSLNKYSENQSEAEFADYTEAPDIICEWFSKKV